MKIKKHKKRMNKFSKEKKEEKKRLMQLISFLISGNISIGARVFVFFLYYFGTVLVAP